MLCVLLLFIVIVMVLLDLYFLEYLLKLRCRRLMLFVFASCPIEFVCLKEN